jgi:hypothetical protein
MTFASRQCSQRAALREDQSDHGSNAQARAPVLPNESAYSIHLDNDRGAE